MKHSLSATLLVLALPFVAGSQEPSWKNRAQDPDEQQDAEQDPDEPVSARDLFGRTKKSSPLQKSLIGCWQIMDFELEGYTTEGRNLLGYLLFTDDFVAFELQASWNDPQRSTADAYQTFISEYRLKPDGTMQLQTLVGSYLDAEFASLEWETPGFGRQLRIEQITRSQIVLHFETGGSMTFARRLRSQSTPRSIQGLPAEAGAGEPDVFGRDGERADKDD